MRGKSQSSSFLHDRHLLKDSIITIYLQIKLLKCSPLVTPQQDCSIRLKSFASAATIRHYQLPAKTIQFRLNRFSQNCSCFREFKEKKKQDEKEKNPLPACYFLIIFDCFLNFPGPSWILEKFSVIC